jgi:hypothetical protein
MPCRFRIHRKHDAKGAGAEESLRDLGAGPDRRQLDSCVRKEEARRGKGLSDISPSSPTKIAVRTDRIRGFAEQVCKKWTLTTCPLIPC